MAFLGSDIALRTGGSESILIIADVGGPFFSRVPGTTHFQDPRRSQLEAHHQCGTADISFGSFFVFGLTS